MKIELLAGFLLPATIYAIICNFWPPWVTALYGRFILSNERVPVLTNDQNQNS